MISNGIYLNRFKDLVYHKNGEGYGLHNEYDWKYIQTNLYLWNWDEENTENVRSFILPIEFM